MAHLELDNLSKRYGGVLTVDSIEQAAERVQGGSKRDTGRHAVDAVLASLAVKDALAGRRGPAGFAVS